MERRLCYHRLEFPGNAGEYPDTPEQTPVSKTEQPQPVEHGITGFRGALERQVYLNAGDAAHSGFGPEDIEEQFEMLPRDEEDNPMSLF